MMVTLMKNYIVPILFALHACLTGASQVVLTDDDIVANGPRTGNIPYTLPTERTFLLNVPAAYRHGEPHPLVLSFHGGESKHPQRRTSHTNLTRQTNPSHITHTHQIDRYKSHTSHSQKEKKKKKPKLTRQPPPPSPQNTAGGTSENQQRITELSDPALRIAGKPFLTAYAQGLDNTDEGMHRIWKGAPYENATARDVAYVHDVAAAVSAAYTVDRARVYACGKSNGGGLAALLACRPDTSRLLAAVAAVSPALYQGTFAFHNCSPSRPVPVLHVHGVEDVVTPFYGRTPEQGSFGPEPDVRVWRRQWAERNGCARGGYPGEMARPTLAGEVHDGVWEEVWDCPGGAEVRALSVEGLGHAWPSTLGLDLAGRPNHTANFNFTSHHLVQFFSRHSL